jgi:sugar phosphate isomerase/epimerase
MRFVYFTKFLRELDVKGLVAFCKEVGLDGVDLAVRPGYPVNPDNALTALPEAAKAFRDAGLAVGLVTAVTSLTDPQGKQARLLFEACGKAEVPAIKVGYFVYQKNVEDALRDARHKLAGFARLAEQNKVRACYHTHSGNMLGGNGSALRLLLQDLDPHHVGAFLDTGHTAIGGGPIGLELDLVRPWLALIAIKDMAWGKTPQGWKHEVVPAGRGIVRWNEFGKAVKEVRFNGTISLHGEYETRSLDERKELARQELALLKQHLAK